MNNSLLTLFFTAGNGIQTWSQVGNLNRELAIYNGLTKKNIHNQFVTYDRSIEPSLIKKLKPIHLLPTPWLSTPEKTSMRLLIRYFPSLIKSDIFKTNQILGSDVAVKVKKILRKPLITRCGYLHSLFTKEITNDSHVIEEAVNLERKAFLSADMGVVTTELQREYVIKEYELDPEKIEVIPNYVLTSEFKPQSVEKKWDLLYVGRDSPQKNLVSLLQSLEILKQHGTSISLLLLGGAGQSIELENYAKSKDLDVTLLPNVPNEKIPEYMNMSKSFILPSHYEGHPKVLLEAMSCGLPCIGTPVRGIQEEIDHGKTGYLTTDTSPQAMADSIQTILADTSMMKKLGKNARDYICSRYSLEKIIDLEYNCINRVMNEW